MSKKLCNELWDAYEALWKADPALGAYVEEFCNIAIPLARMVREGLVRAITSNGLDYVRETLSELRQGWMDVEQSASEISRGTMIRWEGRIHFVKEWKDGYLILSDSTSIPCDQQQHFTVVRSK